MKRSVSGGNLRHYALTAILCSVIAVAGCVSGHTGAAQKGTVTGGGQRKADKQALDKAMDRWVDKLKGAAGRAHSTKESTTRKENRLPETDGSARGRENRREAPGYRGRMMTVRLPNGMYVRKKVVSVRESRYVNVIPQKYDLSCGAAALATILNYYYHHRVDEIDIIKYMLDHGEQEEIQKKGFSLLDLKTYAVRHGFLADGYKVDIDKLHRVTIPVIILFTSGSYSHFVVLKGLQDGNAYIADPAYGNRSMALETFEDNWNGVIFIVAERNARKRSPLLMETSLSAPVLEAMRLKDLFSTRFVGVSTGEF
jgi:predicted double-glycine peptidase